MKIQYTSMFLHEKKSSLSEIINDIGANNIELVLDTNVSILLRELFREPQLIAKRTDGTLEVLKEFLYYVEAYDLDVDYSYAAEEACRSKSDFSINWEKFKEMTDCIGNLFALNYKEMLEHTKLIINNPPVKDTSSKTDSKMNSLEEVSSFQSLLYMGYAYVLKMYMIYKFETDLLNKEKMIKFIKFADQEIDILSVTHLMFASHLFSGSCEINLFHKKLKTTEDVLHGIWNASIDLIFPTLVSQSFLTKKRVPVFVTADENLYKLMDGLSIKMMVTNGETLALPPAIEMNLEKSKWETSEFIEIDNAMNNIHSQRVHKNIMNSIKFDREGHIRRLQEMCYSLENELKLLLEA